MLRFLLLPHWRPDPDVRAPESRSVLEEVAVLGALLLAIAIAVLA